MTISELRQGGRDPRKWINTIERCRLKEAGDDVPARRSEPRPSPLFRPFLIIDGTIRHMAIENVSTTKRRSRA
jgi:hypothetical protein